MRTGYSTIVTSAATARRYRKHPKSATMIDDCFSAAALLLTHNAALSCKLKAKAEARLNSFPRLSKILLCCAELSYNQQAG